MKLKRRADRYRKYKRIRDGEAELRRNFGTGPVNERIFEMFFKRDMEELAYWKRTTGEKRL